MKKGIFVLIILLGFFLRFFEPQLVPPSINWDEASLGYNAYSILKTGKDEWGRFLPITFEAFGDYKLPGYVYSSIPFIATFGLNAYSVRLPSQFAGVIGIILLFFIVVELTGNELLALTSSFILAISPWHVFLSRIAVEANLAFAFFLGGLYCFLLSLKKPMFLTVSAIFFGLTLFTYNSARVFIPLFLIPLVFFYRKPLVKLKKRLIPAAAILTIFILVGFYQAVFVDSNSRFFWVSIVDSGAINYLNQARGNSALPSRLSILIYNHYSYWGINVVKNYLSHFSLDFLFLNGGSNYQFSLPGHGVVYLVEFPLLLLGIISLKKNRRVFLVILYWLLLAPIPASITRESPHALRSIFMLGSLQVISAAGFLEVTNYLRGKYKLVAGTFLILLLFSGLILYLSYYFNDYAEKYSQAWQYGMEQVTTIVQNQKGKVYVTKKYGEPHIFYLFDSKYDPAKYQANPSLIRYARSNWRWVDKLDNINFVNDWEIKEKLKIGTNAFLITSPGNYPPQFLLKQTIYFLDGTPAFDILSTK